MLHSEKPAVELKGVYYAYGGSADKPAYALQDLSLSIAKGAWLAVVGGNGSGKSTLGRLLAGLNKPAKGQLQLAEGTKAYLVLQHPGAQIVGNTVLEEMELSLSDDKSADQHDGNTIRDIVLEVGLAVPLDRTTDHLSGGEQQLLNIASCMAAGATLIIMDEVTSMLDGAARDRVLKAVRRLHRQGVTIVWLTHQSEELVYADTVCWLDQGQVKYFGASRSFLYGEAVSPCERAGMALPYIVQAAKQFKLRGVSFDKPPLMRDELVQAVMQSCRS